jgi:hypothetical protein
MRVMAIKKNESFIPARNYVIAILIIAFIIAATWYGFAWYKVIKENKVSQSYLTKNDIITNTFNSLDEIDSVLSEAGNSYFIYVSYTGDEDIYNMEKDLKKVITKYNLSSSFYFLNVTDMKDKDNYIDTINEKLGLTDSKKKVVNVPTILYYENGELKDLIVRSDKNIMNSGDFQKLLDVNKITK